MKKNSVALTTMLLVAMSCSSDSTTSGLISATAPSKTPFDNLGAVTAFNTDGTAPNFTSNYPLSTEPNGFLFDLDPNGSIDDGYNNDTDDSFDGGSEFTFKTGDTFASSTDFPNRSINFAGQAYLEDVDGNGTADQAVFVAKTDGELVVKRKVYVFPTFDCGDNATACGAARYLDCVSNPTSQSVSVTPEIFTDLGSDGSGILDFRADTTDSLSEPFYFAVNNGVDGDPRIGYILGDKESGKSINLELAPETDEEIRFNWGAQAIAAGDRACYLHYVILGNATHDNDAMDNAGSNMKSLVRKMFANHSRKGIMFDEDQDIKNFAPGVFNIVGQEEAVPASKEIKITNLTSDATVTVTSAADGSFNAALTCKDGEKLSVTATDFTEEVTCEE